jgi:hypothetical protein
VAKKDHLQLYLGKYAEPIVHTVAEQITSQYTHCLVIPVYNESTDFITQLLDKTPELLGKLLIVLVVNQPQNNIDTRYNQSFWEFLHKNNHIQSAGKQCVLLNTNNTNIDLLAIDCFSGNNKLPEKQGVGLARKMGCDIACQLIQQKNLLTTWVHTTDADTSLPENYFNVIPQNQIISAAIYCYHHKGDNDSITQATLLYEKALAYYVEGLAYAGSPYAYHTLGSCIAINAEYYAQARGFPKKSGGEDFYLLNKLAKLGKIQTLTNSQLTIRARASDRVPFGTGPTVSTILALKNPEEQYLYYNPQVFRELKCLIEHFGQLYELIEAPEKWLNTLTQTNRKALEKINIERLFIHLRKQAKTKEQYLRQCHEWFDGFKTLKYIHSLRSYFPDIPLSEALKQPL